MDPKKLEIIKATLPVVKEHGEAITKRFYQRMFEKHPELLNILTKHIRRQGTNPNCSRSWDGFFVIMGSHLRKEFMERLKLVDWSGGWRLRREKREP